MSYVASYYIMNLSMIKNMFCITAQTRYICSQLELAINTAVKFYLTHQIKKVSSYLMTQLGARQLHQVPNYSSVCILAYPLGTLLVLQQLIQVTSLQCSQPVVSQVASQMLLANSEVNVKNLDLMSRYGRAQTPLSIHSFIYFSQLAISRKFCSIILFL